MERGEATRLSVSLLTIAALLWATWALWQKVGLEAFVVDGPSMQPTFMPGDRFLVDRGAYGEGARRWGAPAVGELVVATNPVDELVVIKRVIALGGQRVEHRDGRLWVDGVLIEVRDLGPCDFGSVDRTCREYHEELGGTHRVAWSRLRDFGPVEVPAEHVFLLGDQRDRSNDSRNPLIGPLPRSLVLGRVVGRYWPWP